MSAIFSSILLVDYCLTHQKATHQETVMISQFLSILSKMQFMDFVKKPSYQEKKKVLLDEPHSE